MVRKCKSKAPGKITTFIETVKRIMKKKVKAVKKEREKSIKNLNKIKKRVPTHPFYLKRR